MGLQKLLLGLTGLVFIFAQGCLCRASREDRLNRVLEILNSNLVFDTYGKNSKTGYRCRIIELLNNKINILEYSSGEQGVIEDALFYKGLTSPDLDTQRRFIDYYEKNVEYYWDCDPEKLILKIFFKLDLLQCFKFLLQNCYKARDFMHSQNGRKFFSKHAGGLILFNYQGIFKYRGKPS